MSTKRRSITEGWTGRDRHRLRTALGRPRNARHLRRLQAVLPVASGQPPAKVAVLTGLSRQSIYNLLKRYRRRRVTGDLADHPRAGRPKAAPGLTGTQILRALRQDPRAWGYRATTWTVGLLADHLNRRWAASITPFTLRRRMHALKLRWKRPRYVYKARDPAQAQKKGAFDGACSVPVRTMSC